jgi:hypothetical protein
VTVDTAPVIADGATALPVTSAVLSSLVELQADKKAREMRERRAMWLLDMTCVFTKINTQILTVSFNRSSLRFPPQNSLILRGFYKINKNGKQIKLC